MSVNRQSSAFHRPGISGNIARKPRLTALAGRGFRLRGFAGGRPTRQGVHIQ